MYRFSQDSLIQTAERLCRYAARPPIATERLSRSADGRLIYELRRRWRDGTTHLGFEPLIRAILDCLDLPTRPPPVLPSAPDPLTDVTEAF